MVPSMGGAARRQARYGMEPGGRPADDLHAERWGMSKVLRSSSNSSRGMQQQAITMSRMARVGTQQAAGSFINTRRPLSGSLCLRMGVARRFRPLPRRTRAAGSIDAAEARRVGWRGEDE